MEIKSKASLEKLNEAIDYIEKHIQENLTLEQIADSVHISKYHLHRIFRTMTQEKMMDYVRNRKLAYSLEMLLNTNLKLIDIAYQFGFSYEQSYIRSFNRLFHMTPTAFRNFKPQVDITDKINLTCLQKIDEGRFLIKPRIVIKPDFWVVGTRHVLRYDDENFYNKIDRQGNEFFYYWRQKIAYAKSRHIYIGIIKYKENNDNYRDYITAIEVSKVKKILPPMVSCFIPSQKYAVFTYIGLHHPKETTLKHVLGMYEYIFKEWLPSSGYTFTGKYQMEFIDSSIARDDYCEIELYIPISEKKQSLPSMEWLTVEKD